MKQLIGVLSILVFLGCQNTSTVEPSRFKTIMLKSFGEVETLPNMATFHINLSCLNKSIKTSRKRIVDKSNKLHSKLQSLGISKNDILTTSMNMNKSYAWQNRKSVFTGYKSSTSIFVTIRNIDKLDEIYTELLGDSNLSLGGLNYSHSKLDSLKNAAYVNALEKSKTLTDKLLERLPESKKEILKIGNIEVSASLPNANQTQYEADYDMEEFEISKNKSVAISKGTVKVTATLFVEYQIK